MAKTGSFQRGWRGTAGGWTYQKYGKNTIAKEKATPSNPQTGAQMRHRITFGTIAKAAAVMTDLVGISFQGLRKVADSRRRFVGKNTSLLSSMISSNAASVRVAPKGLSCLIPNPYLVADGTLKNADLGVINVDNTAHAFTQTDKPFQLSLGASYTAAELIRTIYGCLPGDQITVVGITSGAIMDMDDASLQILRDGEMLSCRAYFKSETELDELQPLTLAAGSTPAAVSQALQDYLVDCFNGGYENFKQLLTVADGFVPVPVAGSDTLLDFDWSVQKASNNGYDSFAGLFAGSDIMALGYFRSSYREQSKNWLFSRCQLQVIEPVYTQGTFEDTEPVNYGYTYNVAYPSYVAKSTSKSDRYTETGGTVDELGF